MKYLQRACYVLTYFLVGWVVVQGMRHGLPGDWGKDPRFLLVLMTVLWPLFLGVTVALFLGFLVITGVAHVFFR